MKIYENPKMEIIEILTSDIMTSSPGATGPIIDDDDSAWELDIEG